MNHSALINKAKSYLTAQNLIVLLAVSSFAPFVFSIIALLVAFICIVANPKLQKGLFSFRGAFLIPLFCAYSFLVAFFNNNVLGMLASFGFFVILTIFCFSRSFITKEAFDTSLSAVLFMVYPAVITAIVELFTQNEKSQLVYRCASYFFNANYFGALMAAAVIICAYRIVETRGKSIFYFLTTIFGLIGVYLSGSLFAIMEIAVGITVYLILSRHYRLLCLVVILGSLALLLVSSMPSLLPRLAEAAETTEYRIRIWGVAIREIQARPLFGSGFLSYNQVYKLYEGSFETAHCHNLFLDSMLNFGIVGTSLLIAMFYFVLKRVVVCFKAERSYVSILILSLIFAVLSHCFTDITFFWVQTGVFYVILLGGIGCEERRLGKDNDLLIRGRFRI